MSTAERDLGTQEYWDAVWGSNRPPSPIDVSGRLLDETMNSELHARFAQALAGLDPSRSTLVEIGCANSAWLPYFAREHGFRVTGLDYSELGCRQARAVLERERAEGEVVHADLFHPPASLEGAFDVAFSFGVVEHFVPPESCVSAIGKLLRPGGLALSVVPNLNGAMGAVQRWINRPVYDRHVVHTADSLRQAHARGGLEVLSSEYFFGVNFGWINEGSAPVTPALPLKLRALAALRHASRGVWLLERAGKKLPPSALLSPAIVCVARKPQEPARAGLLPSIGRGGSGGPARAGARASLRQLARERDR